MNSTIPRMKQPKNTSVSGPPPTLLDLAPNKTNPPTPKMMPAATRPPERFFGSHKGQPSGSGPHSAGGCQSAAGFQRGACLGQFGGGLNRISGVMAEANHLGAGPAMDGSPKTRQWNG